MLEVLGYVGGALVLGAVIMLGTLFWEDLGTTGRKAVAIASFLVPALGGAALVRGRTRPELGRILLALACYAAGFAYLIVFEDKKFVVSAAMVVADLRDRRGVASLWRVPCLGLVRRHAARLRGGVQRH